MTKKTETAKEPKIKKANTSAVGAPTKYRPEYCARVIELGKQGKSYTQIASALDVAKMTIYTWMAENKEFMDAMTRAREEAQVWFENVGQEGLFADKFQASLWAKQVSCRFPDDYRDKQDHTVSGGVNISIVRFSDAEDGSNGHDPE